MWPQLVLVRYETPEDVFKAMFGDEEGEIGFDALDSKGVESTVSLEDGLKGIRKTGIYGFVDKEEMIIHMWLDPTTINMLDLLFFLGHEIGHSITEPELPHTHELDEEQRADGYAFASSEAYRLALPFKDILKS
jgi:hypothetical protein